MLCQQGASFAICEKKPSQPCEQVVGLDTQSVNEATTSTSESRSDEWQLAHKKHNDLHQNIALLLNMSHLVHM